MGEDNQSLEPFFNDTVSEPDGLKRNLRIVTGKKVSEATNTKVSVNNVTTSVLAANASRIEMVFVNDSDEVIYLSLSGTAVMNEGIRLNSRGGSYINVSYIGAVAAICDTGGKNLTICEQ